MSSSQNPKAAHAINWFEIPSVDFQRAVSFYSSILDANIEVQQFNGMDMGFFPYAEGSVSGAVVSYPDSKPSTDGVLIYLNGGDDLTAVLERVEPAGGKIAMPKTEISSDIGFMAMFFDSEGNKVALHSRN